MWKKIVGLLAFCLVLLAVISIFPETADAALETEVSEGDSAILSRHIHEVKVEYAVEEFSDHSFNSHYSDKELDSLLNENGIRIGKGKVIYAPDSAFKIFVVAGESCGAYCNPFWETWLHFNDGSGMVITKAGFENVTSIKFLPDGKYLVQEDSWGRSGPRGIEQICLTTLSVNGHEIKYFPFPSIPSQEEESYTDPQGTFCVYQTSDAETNLIADYDPKIFHLDYQYTFTNWGDETDDSLTVYSGYFIYKEGIFIHEQETVKRMKVTFR